MISFDEDLVGDVSVRPNAALLTSMADTPRYQVREVESTPHVPGRSTRYSSLLSPWIYSRGPSYQVREVESNPHVPVMRIDDS